MPSKRRQTDQGRSLINGLDIKESEGYNVEKGQADKEGDTLGKGQLKKTGMLIGLSVLTGCSGGQVYNMERVVGMVSSVSYQDSVTGNDIIVTVAETDQVQEKAEFILPEAAESNPYPWPVLTKGEFYVGNIDTDCLNQMVKRLCYDLFLPMQTLEISDMVSYIEDNPSTHLALRWPELYIRQVQAAPYKQIIEITSVETNSGKTEIEDGNISYHVMCELRYDRKDPSVNGCNIDVLMQVKVVEGQLKIVGLELEFDSRYRDLLAGLKADAGEQELSIEGIDQAFEKLINEL